ncbi:hypothetical protein PAI11_14300 [Patulibacter medicamentivorans]|uniref:Uncharacterized protein n=1 Tax=Patulibacter medicamentivorans TaxID=1097667 RepID=H0E3Q6_9ACTN|nr:hypothetical protein PAI11_14300 [Patulibacter medicamentivorans]
MRAGRAGFATASTGPGGSPRSAHRRSPTTEDGSGPCGRPGLRVRSRWRRRRDGRHRGRRHERTP